jgi:hypothetical protein
MKKKMMILFRFQDHKEGKEKEIEKNNKFNKLKAKQLKPTILLQN